MSNIKGFDSVFKDDEKKDKEEFSVGGKTSSTAVYRPTGSGGGQMDGIIRAARGQNPGDVGARDRNLGTITLYKNGFQIGQSPFRDAKNPKNQAFLASLKKGEVPAELNAEVRKQWPSKETVGVNLVNKSQQMYELPVEEKKYDFSQSKGLSLGGSSSSSSSGAVDVSSLSSAKYVLDPKLAKTTIQIVLHNRQKVRAQFNQTTTVKQLFQHVKAISGKENFKLLQGFPPKPFTGNLSQTLKDAKLIGVSVQQRLC